MNEDFLFPYFESTTEKQSSKNGRRQSKKFQSITRDQQPKSLELTIAIIILAPRSCGQGTKWTRRAWDGNLARLVENASKVPHSLALSSDTGKKITQISKGYERKEQTWLLTRATSHCSRKGTCKRKTTSKKELLQEETKEIKRGKKWQQTLGRKSPKKTR